MTGKRDRREPFLLRPVGFVRSGLKRLEDCPRQGAEGAPDAWVEVEPDFVDGIEGIAPGDEIVLLTWLHRARRDLLRVHPRNDPGKPLRGVFSTRAPVRPNPIGLHRVRVREIDPGGRLRVGPLEVLDGTPVLDIKAASGTGADRGTDEPKSCC